MELTKEQAERIIDSKDVVDNEGVYRAKVTNVQAYEKMRGGAKQVAIVNINLKSDYHEKAAEQWLDQGDYKKAADQGFSLSILEGSFMPVKGQHVDVVIEQVTVKSSGIVGLFAQTCSPAPVMTARKSRDRSMAVQPEGISVLDETEVASPPFTLA
tara:strand:- start:254 stop:721 length:468 start_codon:yes stop_codon:yes gene_type:complete